MGPRTRPRGWQSVAYAAAAIVVAAGLSGTASPAQATGSPTQPYAAGTLASEPIVWGPYTRNCNTDSNWSCRVQANGGPGYQTHYRGSSIKGQWYNGGFLTRTSYHGPGTQTAKVTAYESLISPSAKCVCVAEPCPWGPTGSPGGLSGG